MNVYSKGRCLLVLTYKQLMIRAKIDQQKKRDINGNIILNNNIIK